MHDIAMDGRLLAPLERQFSIGWKLARYHLDGLTDDECMWRPSIAGPHVHAEGNGWRADWPNDDAYAAAPPSIAWLTWHIGFWWSMVLDHSFGEGTLRREDVQWPGTADAVRQWLSALQCEWRGRLDALGDEQLMASELTRWPFEDRPFLDLVAWVTVELTKNVAEIGYVRLLYASSSMLGRTDVPE